MTQQLLDGDATDASDAPFTDPYVDVDEPRLHPVPHRYVHGGFAGTLTRFSMYLPSADVYQGRFFQHITPVPDSENLGPVPTGAGNPIATAFAAGAYYLETNGGGQTHTPGSTVDPLIGAYRANAACARYSRVIASEAYGEHRPYGYAYGGSGGGFRTIGSAENTTGVWDGFVPYVIGSPVAAPNCFTVRMHALRVLRGAFDGIVDALEPGGSGDPYVHLTPAQADALREVTAMGFPPQSWYAHADLDLHGFAALFSGLALIDPGYFADFWTVPGYLGADDPDSLVRDRVQVDTQVLAVLSAADLADEPHRPGALVGQGHGGVDDAFLGSPQDGAPVAVRLRDKSADHLVGAELVVRSGRAAGQRFGLSTVDEDLAIFTPHNPSSTSDLRSGDEIVIDNSRFLAVQTYHRHQDPGPQYPVWDQFRNADGTPRYPQRPVLVGPIFTAGAAGTVPTGGFEGKMIIVASLWDREAYPWQADWYRQRVDERAGGDGDGRLRLYYVDHAVHADDESPDSAVHTVSYLGVLHQALSDLAAWVEQGVPPVPSTTYRIEDGQVVVPDSAVERSGLQPIVRLTVDGARRSDVGLGDHVVVTLQAEAPPGAGQILAVMWDAEGTGQFGEPEPVAPSSSLTLKRTCRFDRPGTHFVTASVSAQRDGDASAIHTVTHNLDRVRVVVH